MIRQTSLDSYNKIKSDGLLSKRRFEVYDILFKNGPLTAYEVVDVARTKAPSASQSSFQARLSELHEIGVVKNVGKKVNKLTGHENLLWDVTYFLPEKKNQQRKFKCPTCNGSGSL